MEAEGLVNLGDRGNTDFCFRHLLLKVSISIRKGGSVVLTVPVTLTPAETWRLHVATAVRDSEHWDSDEQSPPSYFPSRLNPAVPVC